MNEERIQFRKQSEVARERILEWKDWERKGNEWWSYKIKKQFLLRKAKHEDMSFRIG